MKKNNNFALNPNSSNGINVGKNPVLNFKFNTELEDPTKLKATDVHLLKGSGLNSLLFTLNNNNYSINNFVKFTRENYEKINKYWESNKTNIVVKGHYAPTLLTGTFEVNGVNVLKNALDNITTDYTLTIENAYLYVNDNGYIKLRISGIKYNDKDGHNVNAFLSTVNVSNSFDIKIGADYITLTNAAVVFQLAKNKMVFSENNISLCTIEQFKPDTRLSSIFVVQGTTTYIKYTPKEFITEFIYTDIDDNAISITNDSIRYHELLKYTETYLLVPITGDGLLNVSNIINAQYGIDNNTPAVEGNMIELPYTYIMYDNGFTGKTYAPKASSYEYGLIKVQQGNGLYINNGVLYSTVENAEGSDKPEGTASFTSFVFTNTNEDISGYRPAGGSYDHPYPNDTTLKDGSKISWTDSITNGYGTLTWMTRSTFFTDGQHTDWTAPMLMKDTDYMDVQFSRNEFLTNESGEAFSTPEARLEYVKNTLKGPSGYFVHRGDPEYNNVMITNGWYDNTERPDMAVDAIWMAMSTMNNGVWGPWHISKIKGEDGSDASIVSFVFCNAQSDLSEYAPVGGNYVNPYPEPNPFWIDDEKIYWTDSITKPSGDDVVNIMGGVGIRTWMTHATFFNNGKATKWTTPMLVKDTEYLDIQFHKDMFANNAYSSKNDPSDGTTIASNTLNAALNSLRRANGSYVYRSDNDYLTFMKEHGWYDHEENPEETYDAAWMAISRVENGVWSPWIVQRIKGEAGTSELRIYTRTTLDNDVAPSIAIPELYKTNEEYQKDDYIPTGWTFDPQGVDGIYTTEWVAIRKKEWDPLANRGVWDKYSAPAIWAEASTSQYVITLDNDACILDDDCNDNVTKNASFCWLHVFYGSDDITLSPDYKIFVEFIPLNGMENQFSINRITLVNGFEIESLPLQWNTKYSITSINSGNDVGFVSSRTTEGKMQSNSYGVDVRAYIYDNTQSVTLGEARRVLTVNVVDINDGAAYVLLVEPNSVPTVFELTDTKPSFVIEDENGNTTTSNTFTIDVSLNVCSSKSVDPAVMRYPVKAKNAYTDDDEGKIFLDVHSCLSSGLTETNYAEIIDGYNTSNIKVQLNDAGSYCKYYRFDVYYIYKGQPYKVDTETLDFTKKGADGKVFYTMTQTNDNVIIDDDVIDSTKTNLKLASENVFRVFDGLTEITKQCTFTIDIELMPDETTIGIKNAITVTQSTINKNIFWLSTDCIHGMKFDVGSFYYRVKATYNYKDNNGVDHHEEICAATCNLTVKNVSAGAYYKLNLINDAWTFGENYQTYREKDYVITTNQKTGVTASLIDDGDYQLQDFTFVKNESLIGPNKGFQVLVPALFTVEAPGMDHVGAIIPYNAYNKNGWDIELYHDGDLVDAEHIDCIKDGRKGDSAFVMSLDNDNCVFDDTVDEKLISNEDVNANLKEATRTIPHILYGGDNADDWGWKFECNEDNLTLPDGMVVKKDESTTPPTFYCEIVDFSKFDDGSDNKMNIIPSGNYSFNILASLGTVDAPFNPALGGPSVGVDGTGSTTLTSWILYKSFNLTVDDISPDGSSYKLNLINDIFRYDGDTYDLIDTDSVASLNIIKLLSSKNVDFVSNIDFNLTTNKSDITNAAGGTFWVLYDSTLIPKTSGLKVQHDFNAPATYEKAKYQFDLYYRVPNGVKTLLLDSETLDCVKNGKSGYNMSLSNDNAIIDDTISKADGTTDVRNDDFLKATTKVTPTVYLGNVNKTDEFTFTFDESTTGNAELGSMFTLHHEGNDFWLTYNKSGKALSSYSSNTIGQRVIPSGTYSFVIKALKGTGTEQIILNKTFSLVVNDITPDGSIYSLVLTGDVWHFAGEPINGTEEYLAVSGQQPAKAYVNHYSNSDELVIKNVNFKLSTDATVNASNYNKGDLVLNVYGLTATYINENPSYASIQCPATIIGTKEQFDVKLYYIYDNTARLVDSEVIDCIKTGVKGEAGLASAVLRSRGEWQAGQFYCYDTAMPSGTNNAWIYNGVTYTNDNLEYLLKLLSSENIRYVDAVGYNGDYYVCRKPHVSSDSVKPSRKNTTDPNTSETYQGAQSDTNDYWAPMTDLGAFVASDAFIKRLRAEGISTKDLVVRGNDSHETIYGGMTGSEDLVYKTSSGSSSMALGTATSLVNGGISQLRLWLGSTYDGYDGTGLKPNEAPFRVYQDGSLYASAANISGTITATDGSFNGALVAKTLSVASGQTSINADGVLTATGANISGTITATDGSFSGVVHATGGEFTGTVTATDGSFSGVVHATGGEFTGTVTAIGGSFTGDIVARSLKLGTNTVDVSSSLATKTEVEAAAAAATSAYAKALDAYEAALAASSGGGASTGITDWDGFVEIVQETNGETKNFYLEKDGLLTANNAVITGTIYATTGTFAGDISAAHGTFAGAVNASSLRAGDEDDNWMTFCSWGAAKNLANGATGIEGGNANITSDSDMVILVKSNNNFFVLNPLALSKGDGKYFSVRGVDFIDDYKTGELRFKFNNAAFGLGLLIYGDPGSITPNEEYSKNEKIKLYKFDKIPGSYEYEGDEKGDFIPAELDASDTGETVNWNDLKTLYFSDIYKFNYMFSSSSMDETTGVITFKLKNNYLNYAYDNSSDNLYIYNNLGDYPFVKRDDIISHFTTLLEEYQDSSVSVDYRNVKLVYWDNLNEGADLCKYLPINIWKYYLKVTFENGKLELYNIGYFVENIHIKYKTDDNNIYNPDIEMDIDNYFIKSYTCWFIMECFNNDSYINGHYIWRSNQKISCNNSYIKTMYYLVPQGDRYTHGSNINIISVQTDTNMILLDNSEL